MRVNMREKKPIHTLNQKKNYKSKQKKAVFPNWARTNQLLPTRKNDDYLKSSFIPNHVQHPPTDTLTCFI